MSNTTYYQQNRDMILNRAKNYYKNDQEKLKEQARYKYRNLSEKDKNKKRGIWQKQISQYDCREKKQRLKEYQKNYREAKKSQSDN